MRLNIFFYLTTQFLQHFAKKIRRRSNSLTIFFIVFFSLESLYQPSSQNERAP